MSKKDREPISPNIGWVEGAGGKGRVREVSRMDSEGSNARRTKSVGGDRRKWVHGEKRDDFGACTQTWPSPSHSTTMLLKSAQTGIHLSELPKAVAGSRVDDGGKRVSQTKSQWKWAIR